MRIIWYPTFYCNNYNGSCPYCHEYSQSRYRKYTDWYEKCENKNNISNTFIFFRKNFSCDINLTGGEPLLYPEKIIGALQKSPNSWSLNTNAQLTENVIKVFDNMNIDNCSGVCCSFHPLSNKHDNYIESVRYIFNKGIIPQINYVVSNQTINRIYDDLYKLRSSLDRNIPITLIREISSLYSSPPNLIDDFDNTIVDFTRRVKEQIDNLRKKYRRHINIVQNTTQQVLTNRKCRYNREHMVLAPNGDLFPCSCFLYQNKNRICNINQLQPNILKDPEKIKTCSDQECVLFHDKNKHIG